MASARIYEEKRSMMRPIGSVGMFAAIALTAAAPIALAEVTEIKGFTEIRLDELRGELVLQSVSVNDRFPETDPELPLQVVALLTPAMDPNGTPDPNVAAAAVAAQFADPLDLLTPNPEEFAINLTLNSVSDQKSFTATATSKETRSVLFSEGEIMADSLDGDSELLGGRLFLDGALAVFAADSGRDLSGAFVRLKVKVEQISQDGTRQAVFDGAVELNGTTGGADVGFAGDFPVDTLVLSDLGLLSQDFATFRLLVIPNITIDYSYTATVGVPFELEASVVVEAANLPNETGVAAVIGTPTDTLDQVIGATQGTPLATKVINAVTSERDAPTGVAAFPATSLSSLGLCGPLGFGALFLLSFAVFVARPR
jgi:hypothetical protein